jgi:hypothetical protein
VILVALTGHGRSLVSSAAAAFDRDISGMLDVLPGADRDVLSATISQLLVACAARDGVDLLATGDRPGKELSGDFARFAAATGPTRS